MLGCFASIFCLLGRGGLWTIGCVSLSQPFAIWFLRLLQFCSHTMTGFLFLLFSLVVDINNDLSQDDVKEVNENCLIQREGHTKNGQNAVQFCWEKLTFQEKMGPNRCECRLWTLLSYYDAIIILHKDRTCTSLLIKSWSWNSICKRTC